MMHLSRSLMVTAVALRFLMGPIVLAAEPHDHSGTTAPVQLQLDHGKKWPTDDVLRRGMNEIRVAMAQSLTPIHDDAFTPAQYDALARRIQTQVDYVIGSCKLPEQADQQLHLVLEQIIDGAADMKGATATGRDQGAVKIVRALAHYGGYFEHAGWQAPEH